ncbi:MAG: hypothetical protein WD738_03735 [Pirellulales bacterium]
MIIFIEEDDAYLRWIDENPGGFVVNSLRQPTAAYLKLHRATCVHISTDQRSNWTAPDYIKICSTNRDQLNAWALHEVGGKLQPCGFCSRVAAEPKPEVSQSKLVAKELERVERIVATEATHVVAPTQTESRVDFLWKGIVLGTPRTYGARRTEDVWRRAITEGKWEGVEALSTLNKPVQLDFEFRVNPRSPFYNRNVSSNGPDLDTMIIGALGGLLNCRNLERPTLRLIQHGGLCQLVTASKTLVENDEQVGFTIHVRPVDELSFEGPLRGAGLSFFVGRQSLKTHRRRAVQQAAEQANHIHFRAPRGTRIEISLAFAEGLTRNPLSADWLEAVIDGLGASRVGTEHFFDGPPTQEFGYDDSVVFRLTCARVRGLPEEMGIHISCRSLIGQNATSPFPAGSGNDNPTDTC